MKSKRRIFWFLACSSLLLTAGCDENRESAEEKSPAVQALDTSAAKPVRELTHEEAIRFSQSQVPNDADFTLVETLESTTASPTHDKEIAELQKQILDLTPEALDRLIKQAHEGQDPEKDLGMIQTLDGRIYEEKAQVLKRYPRSDEDGQGWSKPPGEKAPLPGGSKSGEQAPFKSARSEDDAFYRFISVSADNVIGGDGRILVTSADYAWRAVGVMLHEGNGIESCSGAMISPRLVLTSAHCFTSNGKNVTNPLYASPAARGIQFSGDRTPFGNRMGIWYWWPKGWKGKKTDIRYDYGLILLTDINWSPGYVFFGHKSASALDFSNFNTTGYPSRNFDCAESPLSSGSCGGYMYRQFNEVRSVVDGRMYNKFDFQGGQSGSPVYWLGDNRRVIYGILGWSGSPSNIATRIRSGVFDFLCRRINDPNNQSSYFGDPGC